jgi:hypothetical protein
MIFGGFVVGTAVLGAYLAGLLDSTVVLFTNDFASRGTLGARTSGWEYLTSKQHRLGAMADMFGQPFGTGWTRPRVGGGIVEFGPHNWYVELYLRVGLVGVACALALLLVAGAKAVRSRDEWGAGLATGLLLYGIPYPIPSFCGILLGFAIARTLPTSRLPATMPPDEEEAKPFKRETSAAE